MSFTPFKEITTTSAGSATKYGGDDIKEIMKIFNGTVVSGRRPEIANPWIWLNFFDIKPPVSAPSAPSDANTNRIYTDPTDFKVKIKKTGGAVVDIENVAGGGGDPAFLSSAQTFTAKQTIQLTTSTMLDLYRDGTGISELMFSHENASGTKKSTTWIDSILTDTTVGSEDSAMELWLTQDNVAFRALRLQNNGQFIFGANTAGTVGFTFSASGLTSNRTFTFPDTADTLLGVTATQTPINKTLNASNNTITDTSIAAGDILKSDSGATKFVRFGHGSSNQVLRTNTAATDLEWATISAGGGDVFLGSSNTYGDFDSIFRSSRVKVRNPANTFSYSIVGSAISAARNWTLPLLTADDVAVGESHTQTISNKEIGNYLDFTRVASQSNPAANKGRMYVKQFDANNDVLVIHLKKAGSYVEVEVA